MKYAPIDPTNQIAGCGEYETEFVRSQLAS